MVILVDVLPDELPHFSMALTTSEPATTCAGTQGLAGAKLKRERGGEGGGSSHLAEDDVLAVEVGGGNGGDEELAAVGVGSCERGEVGDDNRKGRGGGWQERSAPALAMDNRKGTLCWYLKFSSANLAP
jgi:hypothetical protein